MIPPEIMERLTFRFFIVLLIYDLQIDDSKMQVCLLPFVRKGESGRMGENQDFSAGGKIRVACFALPKLWELSP